MPPPTQIPPFELTSLMTGSLSLRSSLESERKRRKRPSNVCDFPRALFSHESSLIGE